MFNKDFMWGVATSSAQIEGGRNADGRSDSIWDTFCEKEGKIIDSSNVDIACDSYHLYKQDVKQIKDLGCSYYRFSLSWSRIIPDGIGKVNEAGIKYYLDLIKELKANGIEPLVTLYHWDLPECLQKQGGFLNEAFPEWFEYYTDVVTKAFKDTVRYYITFNEPQCIVFLGHQIGAHAPGLKLGTKDILQVIHNLLLAHGRSVKSIRRNVPSSLISIAPCSCPVIPVTQDEEVKKACYEEFYNLDKDQYANRVSIYLDPIFLGDYPKCYYELFAKEDYPKITKEDLELISQPLDFLCQNIYHAFYAEKVNGKASIVPFYQGFPNSNIEWGRITPEALYYGPKYLYQRYKKPIMITENGMCCHDFVFLDGMVHDACRIDFMKRYLMELEKASKEVPVMGYFYWSLFDNFEWAYGYTKRFGLIYVDFLTQERKRKDSYYYLQNVIKTNEL